MAVFRKAINTNRNTMNNVEINKQAKLSQHFTLGELCKTSVKTKDGNIPSHVAIENLKRLTGWLEMLRDEYNKRYSLPLTPSHCNATLCTFRSEKGEGLSV